MPKLENFTNRVEIDGYPFVKNELRPIDDLGDLVSVIYTGTTNQSRNAANQLHQIPFSDWTDSGDIPYASKDALLSDMKAFFFRVNGGSGGSTAWGDITGNISDQTDLQDELDSLSSIERGATPPSDTQKIWFNTDDKIIYYYDNNDWLSQQIFTVEFNDQGSTPNNTFLRVGNTTTNQNGIGYNVPFDCRLVGLSFNRNPPTAQLGNYWLYSDSITIPSSVIATFTVDSSPRGFIEPLAQIDVPANKYLAIRWNGVQTNNNIVTLQYRKKYS